MTRHCRDLWNLLFTIQVLVALSTHTYTISSLSDMDSIISVSIKSLEKADYNTRRGLSRLIAHLLAMTQSTAGPVAQDKKGKKAATDDNDAVTVVTSGADQTVKTMLSLHDMLKQLSIAFNRAASPRKTRNAIFDVYERYLSRWELGMSSRTTERSFHICSRRSYYLIEVDHRNMRYWR